VSGQLWASLAHLDKMECEVEIAAMLAVSKAKVREWTKDARKAEKQAQQDKAWDLWLDCVPQTEIAARLGTGQPTINEWLIGKRKDAESDNPPESRQHFDIWQFATSDKDSGQQSYFGAVPACGGDLNRQG
jgi:uncharacterized protein YjcR